MYNESGTKVATYTYSDAWGNHTVSYANGGASTGAQYNPFRYRGYYYDTDLGMYYLQSRYYDPNTCRFINADSALYHSMLGYNMFAYCMNNPVIMIDITGQYCVDIMDDDGNPLNDWLFDGASSGGYGGGYGGSGYYIGPGSAYYNYSVRSLTAAYDARLGGYHSNSVSSGITNTGYYFVPCAVSVTDDMAVNNYTSRGSTGRIEPQNLKEKLAMEQVQSNPLCGARQLPITMTDPRWPSTEGWVKMSSNVNDVEIHFVFNKRMGVYDDFKFK